MTLCGDTPRLQDLVPSRIGKLYSNLARGKLFNAYSISSAIPEGKIDTDHFEVDHDAFTRDHHISIDFRAP
jgi:hypothetical protein